MKLISLLFLLSSCAIAPFSSTTTGRTFGKGAAQFEVGNVASNYFLKMSHGISENFDLGYFIEFGNITTSGVSAKYSLLNNAQGYATAIEFLYGGLDDSSYSALSWINSYNLGNGLEVFLNSRYNKVKADSTELDLNTDYRGVRFLSYNMTYFMFAYGVNLWFTSQVGLSLNGTLYEGDDVDSNKSIFGASILINI